MAANPFDRFVEGVLFVVGLAMGSFLNVCIARIPYDESVVRPASRCLDCGKPIRWFDNIPLLSFLLLRGRCRKCAMHISARYPVVEALTAALAKASGVSTLSFLPRKVSKRYARLVSKSRRNYEENVNVRHALERGPKPVDGQSEGVAACSY